MAGTAILYINSCWSQTILRYGNLTVNTENLVASPRYFDISVWFSAAIV